MNIKDSPIKKYLEKYYIKKLSPTAIYEKYADRNGFVSLKVVNNYGYTKEEAEEQGLIIKGDNK